MAENETLYDLVRSTHLYHKYLAECMGLPQYTFSKMIRSSPTEDQTKLLQAVLCGRLKLTDRSRLMKAIAITREMDKDRKKDLWDQLIKQVNSDNAAEARREAKNPGSESRVSKPGNGKSRTTNLIKKNPKNPNVIGTGSKSSAAKLK